MNSPYRIYGINHFWPSLTITSPIISPILGNLHGVSLHPLRPRLLQLPQQVQGPLPLAALFTAADGRLSREITEKFGINHGSYIAFQKQ